MSSEHTHWMHSTDKSGIPLEKAEGSAGEEDLPDRLELDLVERLQFLSCLPIYGTLEGQVSRGPRWFQQNAWLQ